MIRLSVVAVVAVAAAIWGLPAAAQTIDAGAPDGAEQTGQVERNGEQYALPVASFDGPQPSTQSVRGLTRWAAFRVPGNQTAAAVIAGYRARLANQGYAEVFACETDACGGFDFRFGVQLMPPPAMLIDVQDFAQLTMARGTKAYVSVLASRVRDAVYVQTVTVAPGRSKKIQVTKTPKPQVVAPKTPAPVAIQAPVTSGSLYARLQANGRVKVDGLSFARGGASLTPESGKALDGLAKMLADNKGLTIAIVGHSDWSGGLDTNIRISTRRAQAVLEALASRGVARGRLEARGIGYLAPLQSNKSEAGRALNRRVELVLRP